MFTQSCFIKKNNKTLLKCLERMGYKSNSCEEYPYLQCEEGWVNDKQDVNDLVGIDCGTNEELFLAIAALQDDTDNMQWFTDGNEYWQQCIGGFKFPSLAKEKLHKATVQELIELFNK